jgi:site-specific recombinase XerD
MNHAPTTRVERWIEEFLSKQASSRTARIYRRHLYPFAAWLEKMGFSSGDQFRAPTPEEFEQYVTKLCDEKASLSARRQGLIAIRSWFKFLGRKDRIRDNPASRIKNPRLQEHLYRPLTEAQVEKAYASICQENSSWPSRDRAIFGVIYEDALSREEVSALNLADISWDLSALCVGGKWLPMEDLLVTTLGSYIEERDARLARAGIDPRATPALFISEQQNGNPEQRLGPQQIFRTLRRIDPAINPRKLRDACGIHMLNRGADIRIVAALYRTGIGSMERLKAMASKKRRRHLNETHPRARLKQTSRETVN